MQAVEFEGFNLTLAKDQPPYRPLPVHLDKADPQTPFTACFELTDEEVAEVVKTRRIFCRQLTFGKLFHPILISVENPISNIQSNESNGIEETNISEDRNTSEA